MENIHYTKSTLYLIQSKYAKTQRFSNAPDPTKITRVQNFLDFVSFNTLKINIHNCSIFLWEKSFPQLYLESHNDSEQPPIVRLCERLANLRLQTRAMIVDKEYELP